jgi:hypothetical protein
MQNTKCLKKLCWQLAAECWWLGAWEKNKEGSSHNGKQFYIHFSSPNQNYREALSIW